jgi:hypothetical protein
MTGHQAFFRGLGAGLSVSQDTRLVHAGIVSTLTWLRRPVFAPFGRTDPTVATRRRG